MNGILIADKDECALGVHDCPAEAECQNLNGSFACRCPSGHYYSGQACHGQWIFCHNLRVEATNQRRRRQNLEVRCLVTDAVGLWAYRFNS